MEPIKEEKEVDGKMCSTTERPPRFFICQTRDTEQRRQACSLPNLSSCVDGRVNSGRH